MKLIYKPIIPISPTVEQPIRQLTDALIRKEIPDGVFLPNLAALINAGQVIENVINQFKAEEESKKFWKNS